MRRYAPITKIDAAEHMVFGYASTEALDSQGEIVTREALEAALPAYMRFANIREMHQPSAVGVAREAAIDDKGLYLNAEIVTGCDLTEISLVDRPANPDAVFSLWKSADGTGAPLKSARARLAQKW